MSSSNETPQAVKDQNADQTNANIGTPGTNPTWDKEQGNKGKLMNPNRKSGSKKK